MLRSLGVCARVLSDVAVALLHSPAATVETESVRRQKNELLGPAACVLWRCDHVYHVVNVASLTDLNGILGLGTQAVKVNGILGWGTQIVKVYLAG